jgi:hypothetical protein
MNTPRQPNVRPGIEASPDRSRNPYPDSRTANPFVAPFGPQLAPVSTETAISRPEPSQHHMAPPYGGRR